MLPPPNTHTCTHTYAATTTIFGWPISMCPFGRRGDFQKSTEGSATYISAKHNSKHSFCNLNGGQSGDYGMPITCNDGEEAGYAG